MDHSQCHILKEYAAALERENQAKQIEQDALYRHIHTLEQEIARMEHYYHINSQLNQDLSCLRQQLYDQQLRLDSFQEIQKMLEQKAQMIYRLQQLVNHKDEAIERLQQQIQLMDESSCKLRECLQGEQSLNAELQEANASLMQKLKQHERQVKQCNTQSDKHSKQQAQFTQQDILGLLDKYEILRRECELQEQRQEELQQQVLDYSFIVQAKDNELQAKNIRIKQLQQKLFFLQKRKGVACTRKSSARMSISDVFTQPATKLHLGQQIDANHEQRYELMKENNSLLQNQVRTEYLQNSFLSQVESRWRRKSAGKLQVRNLLLKQQKESLLRQLEI